MTSLTITIFDKQLNELEQAARKLGISVADLVRVSVDEFLGKPDEEFGEVVSYVLRKNAELYRRLA